MMEHWVDNFLEKALGETLSLALVLVMKDKYLALALDSENYPC